MNELRATHLMRLGAELDEPLVLDGVPHGTRRIMQFRGGSFSGPRLKGTVLAGGGDWVLQRRDGVAELDIRMSLQTEDGALVYFRAEGLIDIAPEVRSRIMQGEAVDPSEYYFRTAPRFETGAEQYRWLNRVLAIGVSERLSTGMATDIYTID